MLLKQLPVCGKFKFCFWELFENFFFPNIFHLWLVESMGVEPPDTEGQLYA